MTELFFKNPPFIPLLQRGKEGDYLFTTALRAERYFLAIPSFSISS